MEGVGARTRDHVDHSRAGAADFGGEIACCNRVFLYGIERHLLADRCGELVVIRNAVKHYVRSGGAQAVDRIEFRRWGRSEKRWEWSRRNRKDSG